MKSKAVLLDSCCSRHLTHNEDLFINLKPALAEVEIADGGVMMATGKGGIKLRVGNRNGQPRLLVIRNMLLVPEAVVTLISLGQLKEKGCEYHTDKQGIVLTKDGIPFVTGAMRRRIFELRMKNHLPRALTSQLLILTVNSIR